MNITRLSGSGNGTGLSSTAFTTVKIAVFVPIPSVSAARAAKVKAGLRRNIRSEWVKSLKKPSIYARDVDARLTVVVPLQPRKYRNAPGDDGSTARTHRTMTGQPGLGPEASPRLKCTFHMPLEGGTVMDALVTAR